MPPSQLTVPDDLTFTSSSKNMLALKGTATPAAEYSNCTTLKTTRDRLDHEGRQS